MAEIENNPKILIYTCVFEGYDQVFSPLMIENGIDYLIITDDDSLSVPGWQTKIVDICGYKNSRAANRYYKFLSTTEFSEYDYTLYIDGNIRLLGRTSEFIEDFINTNVSLGFFPHPLRSTVKAEVEACLASGKIHCEDTLTSELDFYKKNRFEDDVGLIEATIILKNQRMTETAEAMKLWWSLYERFGNRDQTSLSYVLWKTGVTHIKHSFSFRESNPYFAIYIHKGDKRAPKHYPYVEGRSHDSSLYKFFLKAWRFTWKVRRLFRTSR